MKIHSSVDLHTAWLRNMHLWDYLGKRVHIKNYVKVRDH